MKKFILFVYILASTMAVRAAGPDLETIRGRIIEDILSAPVNEAAVQKAMETLKPDGTWPDINYKDVSRTGFQHSRHLQNMLEMARAFRKPGSNFKGNQQLKAAISSALNYWIANDFICENWWWNEMGTPNLMINILLVMDTDLTEEQRTKGLKIAHRANLQAWGARPGGDLIVIAGIYGRQALFTRNEIVLDSVINTMASEIKVTEGRGLQYDMSFHHRTDNVISTLTYGSNYVAAFAYWGTKIAGTKYKLPEAAARLLVDYYIDGISQSMIFRRQNDPGAMNRDLTRRHALEQAGTSLPENLLTMTNYRADELKEIIAVRKGIKKPSLVKDRFFWHSSYLTHQRPGYFMSVRMHSSRANNMEEPHNEEGIKNHHFGDGSTFISISGEEYDEIFPVWDWQKIPGTTIVQRNEVPHWKQLAKKGLTDFAGAASNAKYSVGAFDFASVHDPLKAKKAWFMFDDEIVCLGNSIKADTDLDVVTTINQALLHGKVQVGSGPQTRTLAEGRHTLNNVNWVYHDNIAYRFAKPVTLHIDDTSYTGSWRSVNHQAWASDSLVSKKVFCAWIDHGNRPQSASYEYVILPNANVSSMKAYSPQYQVISNTPQLQAVLHKALSITQAVFYTPGELKLPDGTRVATQQPCIIMLTSSAGKITEIALSDPTQKLATLTFTINKPLLATASGWSIKSDQSQSSTVTAELPKGGMAGSTIVLGL